MLEGEALVGLLHLRAVRVELGVPVALAAPLLNEQAGGVSLLGSNGLGDAICPADADFAMAALDWFERWAREDDLVLLPGLDGSIFVLGEHEAPHDADARLLFGAGAFLGLLDRRAGPVRLFFRRPPRSSLSDASSRAKSRVSCAWKVSVPSLSNGMPTTMSSASSPRARLTSLPATAVSLPGCLITESPCT